MKNTLFLAVEKFKVNLTLFVAGARWVAKVGGGTSHRFMESMEKHKNLSSFYQSPRNGEAIYRGSATSSVIPIDES